MNIFIDPALVGFVVSVDLGPASAAPAAGGAGVPSLPRFRTFIVCLPCKCIHLQGKFSKPLHTCRRLVEPPAILSFALHSLHSAV